jgi:energy-converting hydrogenase Eha subunit C
MREPFEKAKMRFILLLLCLFGMVIPSLALDVAVYPSTCPDVATVTLELLYYYTYVNHATTITAYGVTATATGPSTIIIQTFITIQPAPATM